MLWAILAVAVFVMLSWKGGFETGIRIIPDAAPMQFNTALCFGLLAIAGLRRLETDMKWWAVAGLGLAAATLLQDYSRLYFGIDEFFQHAWYAELSPSPGRMSPFTAVGFIICAAVRLSGKPLIGMLLLGLVAARASAALIGYGLEVTSLYQIADHRTAMAVHTAALFLIFTSFEICRLWGVWHPDRRVA